MSSNTGGVQQSIQGHSSNQGPMQGSVAGGNANVVTGDGNVIQQTQKTTSEESAITQQEVIDLFQKLATIFEADKSLPEKEKRKAKNLLTVVQDEAQETEPDKDYIRDNLARLTKTLQVTTETVVASKGLWQSVKPILTKLAPWLGVAASFFLG